MATAVAPILWFPLASTVAFGLPGRTHEHPGRLPWSWPVHRVPFADPTDLFVTHSHAPQVIEPWPADQDRRHQAPRPSPRHYRPPGPEIKSHTVGDALDDWLAGGLSGRSGWTVELYRDNVKPLRDRLGAVKLRELTAGDVQGTLDALAERLSTGSLQIIRNCLERAIRHAEIRDLVGRNVARWAGHRGGGLAARPRA
jgi:hypothetical protein